MAEEYLRDPDLKTNYELITQALLAQLNAGKTIQQIFPKTIDLWKCKESLKLFQEAARNNGEATLEKTCEDLLNKIEAKGKGGAPAPRRVKPVGKTGPTTLTLTCERSATYPGFVCYLGSTKLQKTFNTNTLTLMIGTANPKSSIMAFGRHDTTGKRYAIVNAANPTMSTGGNISGLIYEWGGTANVGPLVAEARRYLKGNELTVGEAIATPSRDGGKIGALGADCIVHALGPKASDCTKSDESFNPELFVESLSTAYKNALTATIGANRSYVAIPLISGAIYGSIRGKTVPEAYTTPIRAVKEWMIENGGLKLNIFLYAFSTSTTGNDVASKTGGIAQLAKEWYTSIEKTP